MGRELSYCIWKEITQSSLLGQCDITPAAKGQLCPVLSCPQWWDSLPAKASGSRNNTFPKLDVQPQTHTC